MVMVDPSVGFWVYVIFPFAFVEVETRGSVRLKWMADVVFPLMVALSWEVMSSLLNTV